MLNFYIWNHSFKKIFLDCFSQLFYIFSFKFFFRIYLSGWISVTKNFHVKKNKSKIVVNHLLHAQEVFSIFKTFFVPFLLFNIVDNLPTYSLLPLCCTRLCRMVLTFTKTTFIFTESEMGCNHGFFIRWLLISRCARMM